MSATRLNTIINRCKLEAYYDVMEPKLRDYLQKCPPAMRHVITIHHDLESFPCELYRGNVDVVCAGFPCQPWSCAGILSPF